MNIVCISDTHSRLQHMKIPAGDILIHAGDHTGRGRPSECEDAMVELGELRDRFNHIVVIAGNHDFLAERTPLLWLKYCKDNGIIYLQDEEVTLEGVRIYGTPWQPWFCNWAFNLRTAAERKAKWDLIPTGIDILITHGPPQGYGDTLADNGSEPGAKVGCMELLDAVDRVSPKLHVFGHIHEGYGVYGRLGIQLVNASICDEHYRPVNKPVEITLTPIRE